MTTGTRPLIYSGYLDAEWMKGLKIDSNVDYLVEYRDSFLVVKGNEFWETLSEINSNGTVRGRISVLESGEEGS